MHQYKTYAETQTKRGRRGPPPNRAVQGIYAFLNAQLSILILFLDLAWLLLP